jgi:hypothetical protein
MEHFSDEYVRQFCSIWYDDWSLIERIRRRMAAGENAGESCAAGKPNVAAGAHGGEQ